MPDDVQAKIAKAKAAGYSDAEIQAYLAKSGPTAISGDHPSPLPPGSMQSAPGGRITAGGQTVANPQELKSQVIDSMLRSGNYQGIADFKENDPSRKAYEASSMRWASPGIRPDLAMRGIAGTVVGAIPGAAIGRYIAGPEHGDIGAGIGGFAGGLYGGYRGMNEKPIIPAGISKLPGMIGRIGRGLEMLGGGGEPAQAAGAAREAAGGTAATASPGNAAEVGAGTTGAQAGPAAPKNASELSSVVQRVRGGQGSPSIYTPESLASEQGMSTAALGKGGFNLTIPPEQQRIMQMVQEGKVPMGTPRPNTPAVASPTQPGGFSGLQPPTGESPSFGPPEDAISAATRGAPGINPAIRSIRKGMGDDTQKMFDLIDRIRKARGRP